MQFTVKLSEEGGKYRALCPELGLSAFDAEAEGAVDKLKSLIVDFLSSAADLYPDDYDDEPGLPEPPGEFSMLDGEDGIKLLYSPRGGAVN